MTLTVRSLILPTFVRRIRIGNCSVFERDCLGPSPADLGVGLRVVPPDQTLDTPFKLTTSGGGVSLEGPYKHVVYRSGHLFPIQAFIYEAKSISCTFMPGTIRPKPVAVPVQPTGDLTFVSWLSNCKVPSSQPWQRYIDLDNHDVSCIVAYASCHVGWP